MNKIINNWNEFWFKDVSPYPLALFRILFGTYLLFYFGSFIAKVGVSFSQEGVYTPFRVPDIALPTWGAYALYYFLLIVILAFIGGFKTKWLTPLLLVLYIYYYLLNIAVKNHSYDRVNMVLLFSLCFADLSRVWSVDRWSSKEKESNPLIMGWAQTFICVLVSVIYFGMGIYKITDPSWHDGTMLEMNFHGEWATPLAYWIIKLKTPTWIFSIISWGTIALELTLAFALFIKPIQKYAMIAGTLFHVGIYLTLNIPEFLFMPMTYVLFLDLDGMNVKIRR